MKTSLTTLKCFEISAHGFLGFGVGFFLFCLFLNWDVWLFFVLDLFFFLEVFFAKL